jgi:hypothetical protein
MEGAGRNEAMKHDASGSLRAPLSTKSIEEDEALGLAGPRGFDLLV